jgi:hypothetical protein
MGGLKLHGDNVANIWAGQSDGTPPFILLRGVPAIESATVTTKREATVSVRLSPMIEAFGLRFGVAALPEEDKPETLVIALIGGRSVTRAVPWPRRPQSS